MTRDERIRIIISDAIMFGINNNVDNVRDVITKKIRINIQNKSNNFNEDEIEQLVQDTLGELLDDLVDGLIDHNIKSLNEKEIDVIITKHKEILNEKEI